MICPECQEVACECNPPYDPWKGVRKATPQHLDEVIANVLCDHDIHTYERTKQIEHAVADFLRQAFTGAMQNCNDSYEANRLKELLQRILR